jgi:hypothetical protein
MAKFNYFLFQSQLELSDREITKNEGNRSRAVEVSQTLKYKKAFQEGESYKI